jgi:hypothetical protein
MATAQGSKGGFNTKIEKNNTLDKSDAS